MGKPGKWLKNFLVGKKDKGRVKEKEKGGEQSSATPAEITPTTPLSCAPTTPREKRRWSFRRSSATSAAHKDGGPAPELAPAGSSSLAPAQQGASEAEGERKKRALAVAAATAAAADAAQAAAAVIRLTSGAGDLRAGRVEEAAAVRIQSVYRSYLARKALRALRGLVKLQALVRGHLVRRQATATLRCMQALVTVQARARIQRLRMSEESRSVNGRPSTSRRSTRDDRFRNLSHEMDKGGEENIKIVEMDIGELKTPISVKSRSSYSSPHPQPERGDHRFSAYSKQETNHISPAPSALTEMSPRTCSAHFEDYNSLGTAQSSPKCYSALAKVDASRVPFSFPRSEYAESISYDHPLYPSYMANTESSRAKARSQSAPKQRPEYFERQPSVARRRASLEERKVPRSVRMQRSSSQAGAAVQNYQYPWSVKLDRSSMSLRGSECGSTSTVLTNINYCRSVTSYETHGHRYQKGLPPPHQAAV